jgi:hypothetical protein
MSKSCLLPGERNITERLIIGFQPRSPNPDQKSSLLRVRTKNFGSQREAADFAVARVAEFEAQGCTEVEINVIIE